MYQIPHRTCILSGVEAGVLMLIPCAVGDLGETQDVMVVRCSSGGQCSESQVVQVLLPPPPALSFPLIQTHRIACTCIFFLHVLCLSAMAVGHVSGALDMNRELERQRQDRMVEWSLVDVAAHYAERQGVLIYYCGQWSIKSRTWTERGDQIRYFPSPMPPTSLSTSPRLPVPWFSQPVVAMPHPGHASLGAGAQHVTGEAVQLQRISCSLRRPEGLSLQRGKKSSGSAKVWWHNKSGG